MATCSAAPPIPTLTAIVGSTVSWKNS